MPDAFEIVNVHRQFEISVAMFGAVPFVLREEGGRGHRPFFHACPLNPHPTAKDALSSRFRKSPTFFQSRQSAGELASTHTVPNTATSKPIHNLNPQGPEEIGSRDRDFGVLDSDGEDATVPVQQKFAS
jgi:hypothetical protein